MLMRPPSREEVREAQRHLVLLKAQIREQRLQKPWGRAQPEEAAFSSKARVSNLTPESQRCDRGGVDAGGFPGGPGRPREVARTRGSVEQSPRGSVGGMTWDPPSAFHEDASPPVPARSTSARRPAADGYPGVEQPTDKWPSQSHSAGSHPGPPFAKVAAARGGAATPAFAAPGIGGPAATHSASSPGAPGGMSEGPEEYADSGPLVQCPDCGRQFKEDVLERHMKICKKVFVQKRKQFDSAANRLGDLDGASELIANAKRLEREKEKSTHAPASSSASKAKAGEAVPKWKQQSLAFRQAILAAKADSGDVQAGVEAAQIQQELNRAGVTADTGLTKCPHCGRTFNDEAAKRHIQICLKTFGSKPGGGRLIKGAGTSAATNAKAKSSGSPPQTPSAPFGGDMSARGPAYQSEASSRTASSGPGSRRQAPPAASLGRPSRLAGGPSYR